MEQLQSKIVSTQQILARNYIEENEIERIVNDMLNSLVHVRVKDPIIYMIKYLAGLISEEEKRQNGLIIPGPYPNSHPIAKYPSMNSTSTNPSLLSQTLTKPLFTAVKYLKTKHGGNINHILKLSETNPEDKVGCLLTDGDCLEIFNELFTPIINQLHSIKKTNRDYNNTLMPKGQLFLPFYCSIQSQITSFKVSYSRNIRNYPYCNTIAIDKRHQVELELTTIINGLIKENTIPEMTHLTYKADQSKWNELLAHVRFDINWNEKAQMAMNWPDHRCIYFTENLSTVILINFNDHLQLISISKPNEGLSDIINSIIMTKDILNSIEKSAQFDYSKQYGYMNSSLMLLGAGMTLAMTIKSNAFNMKFKPNLSLMELLQQQGFDSIEMSSEMNTLSLSSSFKLSYSTEKEFIELFYARISGVLHLKESYDLSFDQLIFPKDFKPLDEHIKLAYESTHSDLKYSLSSSGLNLNHLLTLYLNHPNNRYGVLLQDSTQLRAFLPFISKYLQLSQDFDAISGKRSLDSIIKGVPKLKVDQKLLRSISISVVRNIDGYPFPTSYLNQNAKVESLIITALNTLNMKEHFGDYFSLDNENERDQAMKIIKENNIRLSIDDKDMGIVQPDFPSNRGVIQFVIDNSFAVVNDIDHLKFFVNVESPTSGLHEYLHALLRLLNEFNKQMKFDSLGAFGMISACPKFLGTGMTLAVEMECDKLKREVIDKKINRKEYEYDIDESCSRVTLENKITIGRSENEIFCLMINAINSLFDQ